MEVKIHGLKELKRELNQLEPRMQKNILRGAVFSVARQVRDETKANAPVSDRGKTGRYAHAPGTLRRAIIARRGRGDKHTINSYVSILTGGPTKGKIVDGKLSFKDRPDAYYWRFIEWGFTDRGGTHHPGTHFVARAYESMRNKVMGIMASYVRTRLDKLEK